MHNRICVCGWSPFRQFVNNNNFSTPNIIFFVANDRIAQKNFQWTNEKKTHFVSVYPAPASAVNNECIWFRRLCCCECVLIERTRCLSNFACVLRWLLGGEDFPKKKEEIFDYFFIDKSKRQNVEFVASHMNHCSLDRICFTVAWNAPIFTNINTLLHWNTLLTRSFFLCRFACSSWRSVRLEFIQFCSMDFFPLAVM